MPVCYFEGKYILNKHLEGGKPISRLLLIGAKKVGCRMSHTTKKPGIECHRWGSLGNSEKEKYIREKEKTLFLGFVRRIIIGRVEDIDDDMDNWKEASFVDNNQEYKFKFCELALNMRLMPCGWVEAYVYSSKDL